MEYDFDRVYDRTGTDSAKWHRHGPDVLPMPVADMDFPSAPPIINALRARVDHGFFGYGYAREDFHEAFRARLKRRMNWDVANEALIPIPGVIPGFNMAFRAFTKPGDGVLVQLPSYPPILNAYKNHGLVRADALLVRDQEGRYEIDWESFESAIDSGTKAFVLCNPHNPVGRVFSRAELERMASICLQRGLLIISDEIHCDLMMQGNRHVPIASLSPEVEARTITLMAPSKTFNLAGLKASVAVIPNQELREQFEAARGGLVGAVNILGYVAMTAAYAECDPWLDALLPYLTANRDFVTSYVRERMPGVSVYPSEGTYLAWLDCNGLGLPGNDPHEFFLQEAKVALGHGPDFGDQGQGFVRLNFGCPRPTLEEGMNRLARAIAQRDPGK